MRAPWEAKPFAHTCGARTVSSYSRAGGITYEITLAESPHYTIPTFNFRGTPTGIDIRKVVETGILPSINTGIAHRLPGVGQVGAGLVQPPANIFADALLALAAEG